MSQTQTQASGSAVQRNDYLLFDIVEADQESGYVTVMMHRDFVDTVTWALRNCPDDRRHKKQAGLLSSQLFKVLQWLYGRMPLQDLVDRNGRELVEIIIDHQGNEHEFRKTA